ncbi:MAG: AAA family ATPase [Candidatus Altiarchaeota archaeon]|nr:AAA family ATPase [Candidatus Altiarchaeota archaeon]
MILALSGKGGTGKTTMAAFLVRYLAEKKKSILAIDADPDENFAQALGVGYKKTIGDVRELFTADTEKIYTTMDKDRWFDAKVFETMAEGDGFDLVVMGRPEKEGCYCAVNHMIRKVIDSLNKKYDYVIVDCEPGLEHLSRRTTDDVDIMIVVTDQSERGVETADRIRRLAVDLGVKFERFHIVANRMRDEFFGLVNENAKRYNLGIEGRIDEDPAVSQIDLKGGSVYRESERLKSYKQFTDFLKKIGL